MNNLIDIKELTKKDIISICALAHDIEKNSDKINRKILKGKTIVNLFFENSTRTLVSFELAAKRLGADVINVNLAYSSTKKGETLKDTILTLEAMQVDVFIVRHPENMICEKIRAWLKPTTALINAGDGNNQHPTQALLDIYTISKHKQDIASLKISILGDIKHSRVANSLIDALSLLDNKKIHLYGPPSLLPSESKAIVCQSLKQALESSDVIIMLRIQKERMQSHNIPNLENYNQNYGLNKTSLSYAKHNCIVMHPGPINRGVEIDSETADNSPSVILEQVKNGIIIRQAVLTKLLYKK